MQTYRMLKYKNELSDKIWKELFGSSNPKLYQRFYILVFDPIFDLGFNYAMKGDDMKKKTAKKQVKKTTSKKK